MVVAWVDDTAVVAVVVIVAVSVAAVDYTEEAPGIVVVRVEVLVELVLEVEALLGVEAHVGLEPKEPASCPAVAFRLVSVSLSLSAAPCVLVRRPEW